MRARLRKKKWILLPSLVVGNRIAWNVKEEKAGTAADIDNLAHCPAREKIHAH